MPYDMHSVLYMITVRELVSESRNWWCSGTGTVVGQLITLIVLVPLHSSVIVGRHLEMLFSFIHRMDDMVDGGWSYRAS